MSREAVEQVIGKLMIDNDFRESVRSNGASALASYDLTFEEREQLVQGEPQFHEAAQALEARVSKMTIPSPLHSN